MKRWPDRGEPSMPEGNKITIISSRHCPGCEDLKKAIRELGLKNIATLDIEKSKKGSKLADSLNISAVPIAVIGRKKYSIFRDSNCLIFQSRGKKIKVCKRT